MMGTLLLLGLSLHLLETARGTRGPENDGKVELNALPSGFAAVTWDDDPFDVPEGTDKDFAKLQLAITNKVPGAAEGEPPPDTPDDELSDIKPKKYPEVVLMDLGDMQSGLVNIFPGPITVRLRWSPEMLAAGTLYALLKIQNVRNGRPQPNDINRIRRLLYRIDDPEFVLRRGVRKTAEYKWVLERAWALVDALVMYKRNPKYFWAASISEYAEYRELVQSLKRFVGSEPEARSIAANILESICQKRQPLHPIHALQIIKRLVSQTLSNPMYSEQLDVVSYECSLSSRNAGQDAFSVDMSCQKHDIDDPP